MRKKWIIASLVAALLGAISTVVSIQEYIQINSKGLEEASFCTLNETINCDVVTASSYAELFGIPVAAWGAIFYIFVALFTIRSLIGRKSGVRSLSFAWAVASVGFLWSLRMAYVAYVILGAVCLSCTAQYAINLLIVITLYLSTDIGFGARLKQLFSMKIVPSAVAFAVIFGFGYLFTASAMSSKIKKPSASDVQEVVSGHFRQSLYDIKASDLEGAATWGRPDAKTTIVVFSDFQCPFCRVAAFNIKPYLQEFRKDVKMVFVNYPLDNSCNKYMSGPMHDKACLAAEAVVCANKFGKFWQYHDLVFKNNRSISEEKLLSLGETLGLDRSEMKSCIDSPETLEIVKSEIDLANRLYISGTPTVLINQRPLRYWRVPEVLRGVIREEIKRTK